MNLQFLDHIRQYALFSKHDKVLLAVSGGLDSMVMLELFHRAGFSIGVAHCNFKLRGSESDSDEALVQSRCKQLGVTCQVKHFDTETYARVNNISIQMAARELRYSWFEECRVSGNYEYLATAHHLNDNLETVLLNLSRGTELKGIPEKNENIIRPLLHLSRAQLEVYANENKLVWRDDSSNAADEYARNFIRNRITPLLRELNPSLEEGFARTIEHLAAAGELMKKQVEQIRQLAVTESFNRVVIRKSFADSLKHPAPVLWQLIRNHGFSFTHAGDIVAALHGESGKQFLSPGFRLIVDRDTLIITPHEKLWDEVIINEGQEQSVLGSWMLTIENPDSVTMESDRFIAWLDKDRLNFPLTWRLWREGDAFFPLGMDHRKKISDFLIDSKVALSDKNYVTVLESAGEIAWIPGYRIDNRFRIMPQSRRAVRLTLGQYFV